MRFRGAVLHALREPLRVEEVALDEPGPRDVLIRNRASGLCHSDLEVIEGSLPFPLPIVLGHEGAGIVERVGSEVTRVKPGDAVVASWNPSCGDCFYCRRDQPVLCEPFTRNQPKGQFPDGRTRLSIDGARCSHFGVVSSHAEYSMVPESGAIPIPPEMPLDRACLIGCGVMTGVGAVVRMAEVTAGSTIAVVGAGAVGLNAIQGGRISGCDKVVAIDRDPQKLSLAARFGATHTLPADDAAIAAVKELTAGRGADAVFECAGAEPALQLACEITRPGGQLVILGKVPQGQKVALRFGSIMGEKRIVRSSYGGARPSRDFPWLARLYMEGALELDELITMRLPLERINEGFDAMRAGNVVRAVVGFPS
jgi:S-(hydroxymethyl)glutathione dehydrogenase / alcohol dehydrogenase